MKAYKYGKIQLICDECENNETDLQDKDDFDVLIDEAKQDGWLITKDDGKWKHICPRCCG